MTDEKVLKIAEDAGFMINSLGLTYTTGRLDEYLKKFANLIEDEVLGDTKTVVKQLVDAAEAALEAMQHVVKEAHLRAEPVCCGRDGDECCGCPEPKWNSVDEVIMLRLHRPQQELTAALAAAKGEGW